MTTPPEQELQPIESKLLDNLYRSSGLTAAKIADATGLSVSTVRISLAGVRYREGKPYQVVPPDTTMAKLAAVLGLSAEALEGVGRDRAAQMLSEMLVERAIANPDLDSVAAIAGRQTLVRQVLALFSAKELNAELERRGELSDKEEHDAFMQEVNDDAADEWRATR